MSGPESAAVAALVVLVSAPVVRHALVRGRVLDRPNSRSSHVVETPRGGGLAVAFGCLLAAVVGGQLRGHERTGVMLVAAAMAAIGLLDDLRPIEPGWRLSLQAVASALGVAYLCRSLGGSSVWQLVFAGGVFLWLIAYVNAFNFMDGINGISVAQVVVAGVSWWAIGTSEHATTFAAVGLVVAAAGAAFSPFNVPRARMFLGDVGSYFLGGWLAAAAVIGLRSQLPPEAVLAPLTLYCADTLTTLLRRVRRREPWIRPHREHVYQRLVQAGWSHGQTALAVAAVLSVCAGLGAVSLTGSVALRGVADALIGAVLLAYLRNPWAQAVSAPTGAAPPAP